MSYRATKKAKQMAQIEAFKAVLALPKRVQGDTLFALWHTKLPKAVRRLISPSLRNDWLIARQKHWATFDKGADTAFEYIKEQIQEQIDNDNDSNNNANNNIGKFGKTQLEILEELESGLFDICGPEIEELNEMLLGLTNIKSILIRFDYDKYCAEFNPQSLTKKEKKDFKMALGMALASDGIIVLHEELPLKTQVKKNNELIWKNKERVYGLTCIGGSWQALSDSEMKNIGIVVDPAINIGNAKIILKKFINN